MAKTSTATTLTAVAIVLIAAAMVLPYSGLVKQQAAPSGGSTVILPSGETATVQCKDTLQAIKARTLNTLNTSGAPDYVSSLFYRVNADNGQYGSAAATAVAGTFATIDSAPICPANYKLVNLGNATTVYSESDVFPYDGNVVEKTVSGARASTLLFKVYSDTYVALTNTSGDFNNITMLGSAWSTNWVLGTGKVAYVYMKPDKASAQFGSAQAGGAVVCGDFDTSKFSKSSVVLDSMTSGVSVSELTALPTYCGDNGYDKAWSLTPISKESQFRLSVTADRGVPSATVGSPVKLLVLDYAGFQKGDGTIGKGIADESNTLIGATDNYITINVTSNTA